MAAYYKTAAIRKFYRQSAWGRFNSVTTGSFRESEFNDSFPAMNLKSRQAHEAPLTAIYLRMQKMFVLVPRADTLKRFNAHKVAPRVL